MEPIPNNVDWSATAAWIALAISIIGTVVGPIITTHLSNKHQLMLRNLEIKHKQIEEYAVAKSNAIEAFSTKVGACIANPTCDSLQELGSAYHKIYVYVPESLWHNLDCLYDVVCNEDWEGAQYHFHTVMKQLAEVLKEESQEIP